MEGEKVGIIFALLYAFFNQLGDMSIKFILDFSPVKVSIGDMLLVRCLVQLIMVGSNMAAEGKNILKLSKIDDGCKEFVVLFGTALARVLALTFFAMALQRINLGLATILNSTVPAVCILLAWIFLREKTKGFDILFGLIASCGILIVVVTSEPAKHKDEIGSYIYSLLCFDNHNVCLVVKEILQRERSAIFAIDN